MKKISMLAICLSGFGWLLAQNVGIGTTTPAVRLHIVNSTDELVRLQGIQPYLSLYNAGTPIGYIQAFGTDVLLGTFNGNPTGSIRFYNNNIENMRILVNGNVGIGTSTPASPLSFPNVLGKKISFWNSGSNNDYGIGIQPGTMQIYTAGQDLLTFGYGSSSAFNETMRFATGSGQLMIGTSTAAGRLHILKDAEALRLTGSGTYLSLYNGSTYKGYLWSRDPNDIELGTAVGNTDGNVNLRVHGEEGLTVQNNGRVRVGPYTCIIGTGNLLPRLSITEGLGFRSYTGELGEWSIYYPGSAEQKLTFCYNGGIKARVDQSDGSWDEVSDVRLKEDFETFKPVLDDLKNLNILTYHYKANNPGVRSFGMLAQNVQQYFPEMVSQSGNDNLLGLDYSKTGVIAIKAIQEQQVLIETQQKTIDYINKEINRLKEQNEKLASLINKLSQNK